jgi:hypothetical protein
MVNIDLFWNGICPKLQETRYGWEIFNNYWALDFVHRPIFQKLEYTTFQKLDLFPSSGEWETPTVLVPLERANHSHSNVQWLRLAIYKGPITASFPPLTCGRERIQFPKLCVP